MNYANIKPWQRSAALERDVLEKTPAEVSEIFRALGKTEFTARALGLACRYRGLEMVKTLVEGGAVFYYDPEFVRLRFWEIFGVKFSGRFPDHSLALIDYKENTALRHFNWLLEKGIPENVEAPGILPETERLKILEYLCDNAEKVGFKPGEFLFYLYFADDGEMISALKKRGVSLSEERVKMLTEGARLEEWSDYCFLTQRLADKDFIRVMRNIIGECGDKKLNFTRYLWDVNLKRFTQPDFFGFLLENFNQSKMNKTSLMIWFINSGNVSCLELAAENGWLKLPKKRDEMIDYATEKGKTECAAYLLEFKNRTADLTAERVKAEKKLEREFNADPNSVTELKKNWNFKRNDDGTLVITGYKGGGTVLNVPEKIGNGAVTEIGDWALSPHAPRIKEPTREFRKTITRITLPEGLKKIGESAFCDLISLESVNIPESVISIGEYAFRDCVSLKTIIVPDGVKDIDANAFSMQHSRGALEYVRLPRTLGYFNKDCKWWRVYLFHAANCPDLVVGVPRAPHVEEFCEHNKIKFEYYD